MAQASRDQNRVASLIGVSSVDLVTPTRVAVNPTTGALLLDGTSLYANLDTRYVNLTGNETVAGIKTFSSFPVTPSSAPTTDYQVANKKYVDDGIAGIDLSTRATVELDNLSSVAINTSLISDADSTDDLGSSTYYWKDLYVDKIYLNSTATLDGATAGQVSVVGNLGLEATTATTGIVYSGANLLLHTYGTNNAFFGVDAGNLTLTGESNFGLGDGALNNLSDGQRNTAIGTSALTTVSTGDYNVAIGFSALGANNANNNVAIGESSMAACTSSGSVAIGRNSSRYVTSGSQNVAIGYYAHFRNVTGYYNTIIGYQAGMGAANQSQIGNTFVGHEAGKVITTGGYNTLIGHYSGLALNSGGSNIFIGYAAGSKQTTLGNLLIVDNQVRADVATEITNSLLYGVMAGLPANQTLRVNAALTTDGFVRKVAADYRRYYHLPMTSLDPGASGATWTDATANNLCGWQLNASTETLEFQSDVHSDWDAASDLQVNIKFQLLDAGSANDTVDLKLICYYMGTGDVATKTQTVEVPTTTDGTQYKLYKATFTINYDETDNVVDASDSICFVLNLETDTSEIDNILIVDGSFNYNTAHLGIESGDT